MHLETVMQRLRKKAAARKEDLAHGLAKGQCADYAAYKAVCGEYKGLTHLEEMVKEVLSEIHAEEDE